MLHIFAFLEAQQKGKYCGCLAYDVAYVVLMILEKDYDIGLSFCQSLKKFVE